MWAQVTMGGELGTNKTLTSIHQLILHKLL